MKNLFEYLISKENKNKVKKGFIKKSFTTGDIVKMSNGNFYMFVSTEDMKVLGDDKKEYKEGEFTYRKSETIRACLNLQDFNNSLVSKYGVKILKIWKASKDHKFHPLDINDYNLTWFIKNDGWELIYDNE